MSPTRIVAEPASRTSFRIRPRRWLQFSIRTLLGVTFIACCLMAWVAHKRDEAAQQQQAYQLIVDKHGMTNFGPESARPPWLRLILGEDVSGSGGCIFQELPAIGHGHLPDKGLVHLGKLSRLKYLNLNKTQISDDGLKSLHACHSLEFLSLSGTRTTPAGVERLRAALPDLHVIDRDETELPALRPKN